MLIKDSFLRIILTLILYLPICEEKTMIKPELFDIIELIVNCQLLINKSAL